MFKETHAILGTRDIQRAIAFYTQQLGFKLAFGDKVDPPKLRRVSATRLVSVMIATQQDPIY
jgi:catechol 2,3-dioxygenase-like lactoylglutathione lyase family enzyme